MSRSPRDRAVPAETSVRVVTQPRVLWLSRLAFALPCLILIFSPLPAKGGDLVKLITLDPGHFHAALVQKFMYPEVSPVVHVYAPPGRDLEDHLKRVQGFNSRAENATRWEQRVYTQPDFLERMKRDRPGNVVVLAGNNTRKTKYIYQSVDAGFNVLADKPMAINPADFKLLRKAFDRAAKKEVLLYDIMTERFEIATILQRELARTPEVFGNLVPGTPQEPGVEMESVHYFLKEVDGRPLIRPAWFFDVRQEGEAIPDVGTHLIDLVQWECFPDQALDWKKDIRVRNARRWATKLTPDQFQRVTGVDQYPEFLKQDIDSDGVLNVFGNGEVNYTIRGIHAKVTALWHYQAAPGAKDSLYSALRGTRARLVIRQTERENFQPTLYIEKVGQVSPDEFERRLQLAVERLCASWPGLELKRTEDAWQLVIPAKYSVGHEAHFTEVTARFLLYLKDGKLPAWEVPNMLAKYFTTTEAYRLGHARSGR